jgi:hypothetical protein
MIDSGLQIYEGCELFDVINSTAAYRMLSCAVS